jgi:signal transduction histidine kinase
MEQDNQLIIENSNLKTEIQILRSKIDELQSRGEELKKQNDDLKISLDKLNSSKRELEDLQEQKDDLFAVIIHDIKNPAALIKQLVDLLRSYDLNAIERTEIIDDIFETSAKIFKLSQDVTRVLSLEGSALKLNYQNVDLSEIIKDVCRRNSIAAKSKKIDLIIDLNENLPEVNIDINKIDEVCDNLISNAIKFSYLGGLIKVSTKISDNQVIVEISDQGQGISEEDIKKAFNRGIKLTAQPTAGESSSGFGLWIVKKLIDAHNGKVWVKSVLGKGSTFSFSIPL